MVLYESDDFIALASEEIAIRSIFPFEIDTSRPVRRGGSRMAELKAARLARIRSGRTPEPLSGRTMQHFFSATEEENYVYPFSYDVDFNKRAEFDAAKLSTDRDQSADPPVDAGGPRHDRRP